MNQEIIAAAIQDVLDGSSRSGESGELDKPSVQKVQNLVEVLRAQRDVAIFDDQMQWIGNEASRVTLDDLALWLVRRASSVGIARAAQDLAQYLAATHIELTWTTVLSNVELEGAIEFGFGIELLPFNQLPASEQKRTVTPTSLYHATAWPRAAIRGRVQSPINHTENPLPNLVSGNRDVDDAILVLTLAGPSAPEPMMSWWDSALDIPLGDREGASMFPGERGHLILSPVRLTHEQLQHASRLYARFRGLQDREKEHLRVPLERLNRALRRTSRVDSSIELGIALEALFLNDQGNAREEINFRLRVRAARFLGDDLDTRKRYFKLFGDLYSLRSSAVHTGTVRSKIGGVATEDVLKDGYRSTALAIEKVIHAGASPDWSTIVLE